MKTPGAGARHSGELLSCAIRPRESYRSPKAQGFEEGRTVRWLAGRCWTGRPFRVDAISGPARSVGFCPSQFLGGVLDPPRSWFVRKYDRIMETPEKGGFVFPGAGKLMPGVDTPLRLTLSDFPRWGGGWRARAGVGIGRPGDEAAPGQWMEFHGKGRVYSAKAARVSFETDRKQTRRRKRRQRCEEEPRGGLLALAARGRRRGQQNQ